MIERIIIFSELVLVLICFFIVIEGEAYIDLKYELGLPYFVKLTILALSLGAVIFSGNRVKNKLDELKKSEERSLPRKGGR